MEIKTFKSAVLTLNITIHKMVLIPKQRLVLTLIKIWYFEGQSEKKDTLKSRMFTLLAKNLVNGLRTSDEDRWYQH